MEALFPAKSRGLRARRSRAELAIFSLLQQPRRAAWTLKPMRPTNRNEAAVAASWAGRP